MSVRNPGQRVLGIPVAGDALLGLQGRQGVLEPAAPLLQDLEGPGEDAVLGSEVGEVGPLLFVVVALVPQRRDVTLEVVAAENRLAGEGPQLVAFLLIRKLIKIVIFCFPLSTSVPSTTRLLRTPLN